MTEKKTDVDEQLEAAKAEAAQVQEKKPEPKLAHKAVGRMSAEESRKIAEATSEANRKQRMR